MFALHAYIAFPISVLDSGYYVWWKLIVSTRVCNLVM